jgi:formate-dependent nitrite reductase cytochrome c552 subunit
MTNKQLELLSGYIMDKIVEHNRSVYKSDRVADLVDEKLDEMSAAAKITADLRDLEEAMASLKSIKETLVQDLRKAQGEDDFFIGPYSFSVRSPQEVVALMQEEVAKPYIIRTTQLKIQQLIMLFSDLNSEAIVEAVLRDLKDVDS